jgi:isopenicillin-N N-acyltransferase like protein
MTVIPFLTTTGDAHARGLAHGRRFAQEIAQNVETYVRRFAASGLDREEALIEAERWRNAITTLDPAYAEEMRGIADGAGQTEATIALLNARYELAFSLFGKEAMRQELLEVGPDGCTTFGLLPEITSNRHTWLGQNWDWLEGVHGRTFVLRVERKERPSFVCLTEAGIAGGKMGVNECGIGLVENGLASSRDGSHPYCKPFHVRCREVLEAEKLDAALLAVLDAPRTCSANSRTSAPALPLRPPPWS